jgi:hypothetical protein
MFLLLTLLLQAPPPVEQPRQITSPASLERIKRELERPGLNLTIPPPEIARFRVHVAERPQPFADLWKDRSTVPPYVRPQQPLGHYEFLRQVTPLEFRAGTLYPCCVDVVPVLDAVQDRVKGAGRGVRLFDKSNRD